MAPIHKVVDSAYVNLHNNPYGNQTLSLPKLKGALVQHGMSDKAELVVYYDPQRCRLALEWTNANRGSCLRQGRIIATIKGEVIIDLDLDGQLFPPTPNGAVLGLANYYYRDSVVELSFSTSPATPRRTDSIKAASATLAASMREQIPHDVRFTFAGTTMTLWGSDAFLSEHVPFLKSILSSSFAEGKLAIPAAETTDKPTPTSHRLFEDSDDETDELLQTSYSDRIKERIKPVAPGKTISVTEAAYTTYAAVLLWVMCHEIDFAPLRSTGLKERTGFVKKALDSDAFLPAPASPKSVFRLAHLLELKDLQDLAVTEFTYQLSHKNAARELFSDVGCAYPEIRDAALAFVSKNAQAVEKSEGWKQVMQRADQDELPSGASHVALLLAKRVITGA